MGIVCEHDLRGGWYAGHPVEPHGPHEDEPPETVAHDLAITADDRGQVGEVLE